MMMMATTGTLRRLAAVGTRRDLSTSLAAAARVGFIGLGQMGNRMAKNVAKAGHDLVLYDVNRQSVDEVAATSAKARAADSVAEVAAGAEVVITMLPEGSHVRGVYQGDQGLFAAASPDTLFIDGSTIDVATATLLAHEAEESGHAMLDAPVSGGVGGAEAGTLTFMVGGTPAAFDRAAPVLASMGKNVVHCGANGTGQVAKMCNNMLLAIGMLGTCEAMALGQRMGMDPKVLAGIINTSTGRCWSSDTYNPSPGVIDGVPSSRNYEGGFATELMAKDLRLAVEAANQSKSNIVIGSLAAQIYNLLAKQEAYARKDFSSFFKMITESQK